MGGGLRQHIEKVKKGAVVGEGVFPPAISITLRLCRHAELDLESEHILILVAQLTQQSAQVTDVVQIGRHRLMMC